MSPAVATQLTPRRRIETTVEWNETLAMAAERLRAARCDSLTVVDGGKRVGTITRQDIERCAAHGNWLDSVLVVDVARRRTE